ncbi:uncharacterized protein LOC129572578 [Sitodiplosis mosellana]|uniref:uncharacterized protein LOC129572578 n=1 Tax=Sitodiplosis mosellana TaxID=263140 RepID=UPI002444F304|nr:uncharacterized protein LOC129572578 [Sitodiplosis mosellana]
MYFVIFILGAKQNVIVPHSWINDIELYLEEFMNNGVRSNTKFKTFWSEEEEAMSADGIPLASYMPIRFDTLAMRRRVFRFPEEGWYDCKIRHVNLSFAEAVSYNKKRRRTSPVCYNPAKMCRPRSNGGSRSKATRLASFFGSTARSTQRQSTLNDFINTVSATSVNSEESREVTTSTMVTTHADDFTVETFVEFDYDQNLDTHEQNVVSGDATSAQNGLESGPSSGSSNVHDETDTKSVYQVPSQPIFSYSDVHAAEIEQLMQNHLASSRRNSEQVENIQVQPSAQFQPNQESNSQVQDTANSNIPSQVPQAQVLAQVQVNIQQNDNYELDYESDEDDFLMIDEIMPRPLHSTAQGLVKHKDDEVSGDMPYIITKRGRVYEIGGKLIEINVDVLNTLKTWNSHEEGDSRNDTSCDFRFALTALLSILSPDNVKKGDFDREAMNFLTDLLKLRTDNNQERIENCKQQILNYLIEQRKTS